MATPCTFTLDERVVTKLEWLVSNSSTKTSKSALIRGLIEEKYIRVKELQDAA